MHGTQKTFATITLDDENDFTARVWRNISILRAPS